MVTGGLLALGDSITVGEGSAMPGVPCRAWVWWLANALDLPLTNLATDGAQVCHVLSQQLPRAPDSIALACLYVGVNDVRGLDFDLDAFTAGLEAAARALATRSRRLVMVTIPLDLGRPRAGSKVLHANRAIRRIAGTHAATVVANESRRGWLQVQPDAVHLTAVGQRSLAEDALRALAADGTLRALAPECTLRALAQPGTTLAPAGLASERGRVQRATAYQALRYAVTGYAPALWHDLRRRAREGTLW